MSLYSTPSISAMPPESPATTSTPSLPNRTVYIGNLPCDDGTIHGKLKDLLDKQGVCLRLKILPTKGRTTCFGVAYFDDPFSAANAIRNLHEKPFPGPEGVRLNVTLMTTRKEADQHFTSRAEIQPQRPLAQRSYGVSNTNSERKWGYSPTPSIAPVHAPIDTPHTHLSKYAVEEVSTSARLLGDKPFGFNYGAKLSSKGLMGSIYAPVNALNSQSVSSQEGELIDTPLMLVPAPAKDGEIDSDKLKDITQEHEMGKEDSSNGVQNGKNFDLLGLNIVPEPKEQENVYGGCPLQEQSEMSHLNRMMLTKKISGSMAAKKEEVVGKVSHLNGGGDAVVMEAEM